MSFFQLEEMCWSGRGGLTGFDFDGMLCGETTLCERAVLNVCWSERRPHDKSFAGG
jgi:hypothetical protein